MIKFSKFAASAVLAAATLGASSAAHAECSSGFFANLACEAGIIDQQTAQTADRLNAQMGQPFDHGVTQAMDVFVPGSGTAVEAYWAAQRAAGQFTGAPQPGGYPNQNPGYPSQNPSYGMPAYQAPAYQQPQYVYTCRTPQGAFTFAQPLIAGSQCYSMTPYGTFYGIAGN